MFERLLTFLLSGKAPFLAGLLLVSTTGFVVSGTVNGDDVELTVKPIESAACLEAILAKHQTLVRLERAAAERREELRSMRDLARERADDAHTIIDETGLRTAYEAARAEIGSALVDAIAAVEAAQADALAECQDGDSDTPGQVDIARLRETYAQVLLDFGTRTGDALGLAQEAFDQLVATAQPEPEEQCPVDDDEGSGSSD